MAQPTVPDGVPGAQGASVLKRSPVPAILAIFILALALRCAVVALIGPNPNIAGYSESGIIAQNLIEGQGFVYDFYHQRPDEPLRAFIPPLFVGLVYLCLQFDARAPLVLALIHSILSSLACIAVYWCAIELSGRRAVALLAALATACYPVVLLMVTVPTSLTLHLAVLAWAVAFTLRLARRPSAAAASAAGILWGALALGRPALVGFLPFVFLWLGWNRKTTSQFLRDGALLIALAVLVTVPWAVRNYRAVGHIVLVSTNGGFNFWNGNNPFTTGSGHDVDTEKLDRYLGRPHDPKQPAVAQVQPYPLPPDVQAEVRTLPEVELDRQLYRAGWAFARQEPRAWLALSAQKLLAFWWFRLNIGAAYEEVWTRLYKPVYGILLVFLLAGLALSFKSWRRYSLLYLLFGYYTVTNVAFHVLTRYRWEIEPFFLIFAAVAIVALAEGIMRCSRRQAHARS